MNRIISYISQYFGNKGLEQYPILSGRNKPEDLNYTISVASSAVFHDTLSRRPRDIDMRLI